MQQWLNFIYGMHGNVRYVYLVRNNVLYVHIYTWHGTMSNIHTWHRKMSDIYTWQETMYNIYTWYGTCLLLGMDQYVIFIYLAWNNVLIYTWHGTLFENLNLAWNNVYSLYLVLTEVRKKNFFYSHVPVLRHRIFTWQDAGIQTRVAATAARCVSCTHPFVRYYLPGIEQYWQLSLIVSCLRLIHFLKILNIKCNFFVGSYNSHSSNVLYIIWWGAGGNAGCVRVLLLVPGGGPAHPHQGRAAHPRHVVPSHHQV